MKKEQIFAIAISIVLIATLYSLPRVVVENDDNLTETETTEEEPAEDAFDEEEVPNPHQQEVSSDEQILIDQLTESLNNSDNEENFLTFADSLAKTYQTLNIFDSSAKYFELYAEKSSGIQAFKNAGNAYYNAFSVAVSEKKGAELAKKAREFFEKVLSEEEDLVIKNRLAMSYVASPNPMTGILMLREIVSEFPNNEEAIFNLGILSMQSNQYDKAKERFENLLELNPSHIQARLFLGVSLLELNDKSAAKNQFELLKDQIEDEETLAVIESYLQEIN